jgi:hypothetical protein
MGDDDFYEDDEPIEDVRNAWRQGERGITRGPRNLSRQAYELIGRTSQGLDEADAGATQAETIPIDTTGWFAPRDATAVSPAGSAVTATTETRSLERV